MANVNNIADAEAAAAMGASGIGLYRTEYLFLTHPSVPDEQEQLAVYKKIIAASPNHRVTIRTLDLGGDKTIPYLGHAREANPFMGWRSIRLSFEHPEFFATQIRAILRASFGKKNDVRLMFPMITTLEEIRKVRKMVSRAKEQLDRQKKRYGHVPIGLMVEVPAAAICVESLMDEVDFISIGSNDLVQYLMAADRDNPRVSHLCQPLSPAVLQVLNHTIRACDHRRQTLHAVRRNGQRPARFRPAVRHGPAQLQPQPGLHSVDQRPDDASDQGPRRRHSQPRTEIKNHRRRKSLPWQRNRRDRAESEAAGYGVGRTCLRLFDSAGPRRPRRIPGPRSLRNGPRLRRAINCRPVRRNQRR